MFLKNLLILYTNVIISDLEILKASKNTFQNPMRKNAITCLIPILNRLQQNIDYDYSPPEVIMALAQENHIEALHILTYLNLRDQITRYAKMLEHWLFDLRIDIDTTWKTQFWGIVSSQPLIVAHLKKEIDTLQCSNNYNTILDVTIQVLKILAVIPEPIPENKKTIDLFQKTSEEFYKISFVDTNDDKACAAFVFASLKHVVLEEIPSNTCKHS